MALLVCIVAGLAPLTGCRDRNADLFAACEKGDADRIKGLLDRGANVNAYNRNGETPLMVAAGLLYPDAVRLLIVWNLNYFTDDSDPNSLYALWTPQGMRPAYDALKAVLR